MNKRLAILTVTLVIVLISGHIEFLGSSGGYEDFTTFTEVDDDDKLTCDSNTIVWTNFRRGDTGRFFKNYYYSANPFIGDYEHWFDLDLSAIDAGSNNVWVNQLYTLSPSNDTSNTITTVVVGCNGTANKYKMLLKVVSGGVNKFADWSGNINNLNPVYCVLKRSVTTTTLDGYSTTILRVAGGNGDVFHLSGDGGSDNYKYAIISRNGGSDWNPNYSSSGILENLALCRPPTWELEYLTPNRTDNMVYVLVNSTIYNNLTDSLEQYRKDLEAEGFSVSVYNWSSVDATVVRQFLQNEWKTNEMLGALLVGNVPYAEYENWHDGYLYVYPCDLYHMDLDGNWTDSDSNGIYDMHTNETGDLEPEIWVGRLYASTMTGDETDLLINYFNKNHRFRTGNLTLPRRSIGYTDIQNVTGYPDVVNSSLRMIYGNETTLVTDHDTTNAADYTNRLNDTLGYEWLFLTAHSSPERHRFDTSGGPTYVYSSDVRSIDPHVFFYHLAAACSAADYSFPDYIGGSYAFADTYGLVVLGATSIGGMNHIPDFYEPLAEGKSIGQALIEYFDARQLLYFHTILGDPTLRVPPAYNVTRDVAVTSVVAADTRYGITDVYSGWDVTNTLGWNVTINATVKNEGNIEDIFNVTVYYNDSTTENFIDSRIVTLLAGENETLSFIWNTTYVSWGSTGKNYTIKAEASVIPRVLVSGENDTSDNIGYSNNILITVFGDVNIDGQVDVLDVQLVNLAYMGYIEEDRADLDYDGAITILDKKLVRIAESEL